MPLGCWGVESLDLQERARAGAGAHNDQLASAVTEALGRLLIFRPSEPLELLRQLQRLRQILRQNPTAGLLVTWHQTTLKQGTEWCRLDIREALILIFLGYIVDIEQKRQLKKADAQTKR